MTTDQRLLLLSLGPVQGFIATARKGSDLWFGSWLLSDLARTAAKAARRQGATLLVPTDLAIDDNSAGVPARLAFTARFGGPGARQDPQALAQKIEEAIHTRLHELLGHVFTTLPPHAPVDRTAAQAQLRDLPELAWVAVPMPTDAAYPAAMRQADALLNARKNLRPFAQPTWASSAPKSSLDGARESVLDRALVDKPTHPRTGQPDAGYLWNTLRVKPREHLCGPGLLKRWAPRALTAAELADGARTASTSHFAAWNTRRAWVGAEGDTLQALREAFQTFREALLKLDPDAELEQTGFTDDPVLGGHDAGLLFESRLGDALPAAQAARRRGLGGHDTLEAARAALRAFLRKAGALLGAPVPRPSAYYAVVCADGDRMGVTFAQLGLEANQDLSNRLLDFAKRARAIVAEHHGQAVYIGGDDLLLILPTQEALACCDALRRDFVQCVGVPARQRFVDAHGEAAADTLYGDAHTPTLSVGISIAHHLEPFQDVLADARKAEHIAKQEGGRDAWAVSLRKRGGPPVTVWDRWDRFGDFEQLLARYAAGEDLPRGLPRGLPYDLRAIAERLPPLDPTQRLEHPHLHAAVPVLWALELERVGDQKGLAPDVMQTLRRQTDPVDLPRLSERLIVARALTQPEEDAA